MIRAHRGAPWLEVLFFAAGVTLAAVVAADEVGRRDLAVAADTSLLPRSGRIAVMPSLPADDDWIPAMIEPATEAFRARLARAGLGVPTTDSIARLWDESIRRVGGLYDTREGWMDAERLASVKREWRALLRDSLGIEWVLRYEVVVTTATWRKNTIEWDGVSHSAPGFHSAVLKLLAGWPRGGVSATSFVVTLSRPDGAEVWTHRTGIRPMVVAFETGWERIGWTRTLGDPSGIEAAVSRVLAPWLDSVSTTDPH